MVGKVTKAIGASVCVHCVELMGHVEEGIAQCEKNIRLGILPAVSYGVLGQLREKQGDFAAALTAYNQSLTLDPQNTVTQNLLANLRAKMQQTPAKP